MNKKLLALYGLKWNPFSTELPCEALLSTPRIDSFCWRIENALVREGGFALVAGEPGTGKSAALRILAERLSELSELTVGAIYHPQSNVADFYRELGALFGVALRPHNRWGGFQALREKWQAHIESTLMRPVLLIDEAQEMSAALFSELKSLASTRFDSRIILSVVIAGDGQLTDRLGRELLPLGSRIRTRLTMEPAGKEELLACLKHLLATAGSPNLMTAELKAALVEHAAGNFRVMINLGSELLLAGAQRELPRLDEKLFLDLFSPPRRPTGPGRTQRQG